ncbi:MAG: hypothetical protein KDA61_11590, partial [Planctomycetales bacterium]|nr:hypothetical protein [Planctomycetales bacterium]
SADFYYPAELTWADVGAAVREGEPTQLSHVYILGDRAPSASLDRRLGHVNWSDASTFEGVMAGVDRLVRMFSG